MEQGRRSPRVAGRQPVSYRKMLAQEVEEFMDAVEGIRVPVAKQVKNPGPNYTYRLLDLRQRVTLLHGNHYALVDSDARTSERLPRRDSDDDLERIVKVSIQRAAFDKWLNGWLATDNARASFAAGYKDAVSASGLDPSEARLRMIRRTKHVFRFADAPFWAHGFYRTLLTQKKGLAVVLRRACATSGIPRRPPRAIHRTVLFISVLDAPSARIWLEH